MYECCTVDVDEDCDLHVSRVRTARKQYVCEECREPILPGQKYEHVTTMFDGRWYYYRTCLPCMTIRNDLCQSWYYGMVDDQIQDCYGVSLRDDWWGWDEEDDDDTE